MIYQSYSQYTSNWINVVLPNKKIPAEALSWAKEHDGGMYHIHYSGQAIKFERKEDAEWFMLKWS